MKLRLSALALSLASPAIAAPVTDCPNRDAGFSADSPFIDIMLSDPAKAEVEKGFPGMIAKLPPIMSGTKPPSFAAIMSVRKLSFFAPTDPAVVEKLDKALKALPVTATDRLRRCERYDNDRPKFAAAPKGKIRILLFEKINGFKDTPSVNAAHQMFADMASRKGWVLETTEKGGAFNAATLKQFDVVAWNNISGDVLTLSQRKAFESWMAKGGGFLGVHGSAGDPAYFWGWYADTLIGARFIGHPMGPQFQDAKVQIEISPSGIGASLAPGFTMNEEWYSFAKSPRGPSTKVIATLDEASYSPVGMGKQDLKMGDHPIAWTRCVGSGRMYYSAIGHRPVNYSAPQEVSMIEQAVEWTAGKGKSHCMDGMEMASGHQ
jgi:uncharacterized protein